MSIKKLKKLFNICETLGIKTVRELEYYRIANRKTARELIEGDGK